MNLAHSYEALGNASEARRYYDLAATKVDDLPEGLHGKRGRNSIARHRQRINSMAETRTDDKGQSDTVQSIDSLDTEEE